MSPTRLYEHNYNLRKKSNRIFDLRRNQTIFPSPHKKCIGCGIKHKKDRLVQPKLKKKLNRNPPTPSMAAKNTDIPLPTVEDIREDIVRARKGPTVDGFLNFSTSPLAGFELGAHSSHGSDRTSEEDLNKKISEAVSKAVANSHKKIETQMMNMLSGVLSNLNINRPIFEEPPPHPRNSIPLGAMPRAHGSGARARSNQNGSENDQDGIRVQPPINPARQNPNAFQPFQYNCSDIHKWNIRFEKMSAKEFLNCIKIQWEVSGFRWEHVYYNFHNFLPGQSEKRWFYQYLQNNREATWAEFSRAFNRRFGTFETDRQLLTKMDQRKQGNDEPFLEFLEAMERLNASLERPKNEAELLEFLRDNVNRHMRPYIWMKFSNNLEEFTELCVEAENQIKKDKFRPYQHSKMVNEVEDAGLKQEDHCVAAVLKAHNSKRDLTTIECWNCDLKGHFSRDCPSDTRVIHCFRCGLKGTTTPKCLNCGKGNLQGMSN